MKENQKSLLPLQVESEAIDLASPIPLGWIQSSFVKFGLSYATGVQDAIDTPDKQAN